MSKPSSDIFRLAQFKKSSASAIAADCVEVAFVEGFVGVRDSKDVKCRVLVFTVTEWDAFLTGAAKGEFDPR